MNNKDSFILKNSPNYWLHIFYAAIVGVGLFILMDITSSRTTMFQFYHHLKFGVVGGVVILFLFSKFNLLRIKPYLMIGIVGVIIMLIYVLIGGVETKGATRTMRLFGISFQPSVLARVMVVLYTAKIIDKKKDIIEQARPSVFLKNFGLYTFIVAIIFGLIIAEKHLSSIMIMSATLFTVFFLAGIPKRTLVTLILIATIGIVGIFKFGSEFRGQRMKIYKKYTLFTKLISDERITGKIENEFQIQESLKAISSGGFLGTGSINGRGKYYFLPEAKTDYIFTIIAEQWGFLGSTIVIALYIALFYLAFSISWSQDDLFLRLAGSGLSINFFLNVLINIGVAISALPSTGVTLPFISSGGSSFWVNSFALALIIGISRIRKKA